MVPSRVSKCGRMEDTGAVVVCRLVSIRKTHIECPNKRLLVFVYTNGASIRYNIQAIYFAIYATRPFQIRPHWYVFITKSDVIYYNTDMWVSNNILKGPLFSLNDLKGMNVAVLQSSDWLFVFNILSRYIESCCLSRMH